MTTLTPPYDSVLSDVLDYEHPALTQRLQRKLKISEAESLQLFHDTKLFLFICGVNTDRGYVPPKAIDNGWHEFLLYTEDYANFCDRYFGRFLHHRPYQPEAPINIRDGALKTLTKAREVAGDELSDNWLANELLEFASCGSCGCDACGD